MDSSTTETNNQRPTTSLLDLPPELRLQLYDQLYEPCFQPQQQFNPFYCTADLQHCPKRGRARALHQVNRQLRAECLPIYLQRTTFVFDLAVLDPDTAQPTLVSWAKSSDEQLRYARNVIVNLRVVPRSRPLFTLFVSNTTGAGGGQRLRFKENDFRAGCNLLACGMRDARLLQDQSLTCLHRRCGRYVAALNALKTTLRRLALEIPAQRPCLNVDDVVEIAEASRLLELLHIPARFPRVMVQATAAQEELVERYRRLVLAERLFERKVV